MKVAKWLIGSMAAGLVLCAQADVTLTHRYDFDGDAVDSVGTMDGTVSATGTGTEAPLFSTDIPTGADTGFASKSIEMGMSVGTAASYVNFTGAQRNIYDGKAGSVAYWFKADQALSGRDLFSNIDGATGLRTLTRNNGDIRLAGAGMGNVDFSFSGDWTANAWHHLVVTWDDTDGSGTIALDGDVKSWSFTAGSLTDPARLILGNFASNNSQLQTQFDGHFYDLQIYEGELSSAEISLLANNAGTAIPEPATLGLIAAFGGSVLFVRRLMM